MKVLIPVLVFALLACGGMLHIFIPDLPVRMPPDARTFTGTVDEVEGVSTTHVSGISESVDVATLQRQLHDQLVGEDWTVAMPAADEQPPVTLTCSKGAESLVITIDTLGQAGSSYDVVWVKP